MEAVRPPIDKAILSLAIVLLILLAGVFLWFRGSGGEDAELPAQSTPTSAQADSTSAPTSTSSSTTSTAPLPPQTEAFVSVDGDDALDGRSAESAVRTYERALGQLADGGTISFGPGTYPPLEVNGETNLTIASTDSEQPAVFTANSYTEGPAIRVVDSSNVRISDVHATRALWGVRVERSDNVVLDNLEVFDLGQEGIFIRDESFNITVSNNRIFDTGNRPGRNDQFEYTTFGEGIYIGTGSSQEDGSFDETNNVRIEGNRIFDTTAEAIDIKPSAFGITVTGNIVHDVTTATSGAIVVGIGERSYPNPNVVIEGNVIFDISRTSDFRDGNAITLSAPATVRGNVIWGVQHWGIHVDRNLRSDDGGRVIIESNLIAETGLEAIRVADSNGSVEVDIAESNQTGVPISDYLNPAEQGATQSALDIANSLVSGSLNE